MYGDRKAGFTLIELSIVLVIIGLIVGGILTGQSLIEIANMRGQISQIEKFQTAANTFRVKFGYLPGDIPDPTASSLGLVARGSYGGQGDGNGIIQGTNGGSIPLGIGQMGGETAVFWRDLSAAALIDGNYSKAQSASNAYALPDGYLPPAQFGGRAFVYVYSGGAGIPTISNQKNYFGISTCNQVSNAWQLFSTPSLTVRQVFAIDTKVDDGLPQSGRVVAKYLNYAIYSNTSSVWANGGGIAGPSDTSATTASSTTCYDNSASGGVGVLGAVQHYSMEINDGSGQNCALSFQFQ
jgi:prepilin-type N-terminal cleavage/methylation domain-containing protein